MRGYETLIQEAELMAMPPAAVAEFLKCRAGKPKDEAAFDDPVDEEAEKLLSGRGDSLINLALARYGLHMEVVAELFHAAAPGTPVRLACLTNTVLLVEPYKCHEFPEGLLGRDPRLMSERLLSASEDELCALFRNPTLSSSFVTGLLKRREGWESIDDESLCQSDPENDPGASGASWQRIQVQQKTVAWASPLNQMHPYCLSFGACHLWARGINQRFLNVRL